MSKAVFKGVVDLMKYFVLSIEEDLLREPESSIFSLFLILRIAFSVYLPPKLQKNTISTSLLTALNLNSFLTPLPSPEALMIDSSPDSAQRKKRRGREKSGGVVPGELPNISISDTDEDTEELHILRKIRNSPRSNSSPLLERKSASDQKTTSPLKTSQSVGIFSVVVQRDGSPLLSGMATLAEQLEECTLSTKPDRGGSNGSGTTQLPSAESVKPHVESSVTVRAHGEESSTPSSSEGDGRSSDEHGLVGGENLALNNPFNTQSGEFLPGQAHTPSSVEETYPLKAIKTAEPASSQLSLNLNSSNSTPTSLTTLSSVTTPSSVSDNKPDLATTEEDLITVSAQPRYATPSEASQCSTPSQHGLTGPVLLSDLINSPRFYHPREGQELTGCMFAYKELLKGLGHSKDFMLSPQFWELLFVSALTVDRERLGWNEWTISLYEK